MKQFILVLSLLVFSAAVSASDCEIAQYATQQQQFSRARIILEPLVKKGIPCAQFQMGLLYVRGQGVKTDTEKGLELIKKADEAGDPEARHFIRIYH